jgi:uncharacterized protein (AIM24 family)
VAEAGGMMYMEDGIEMETIFGDGSSAAGGFLRRADGCGQAPAHGRIAVHDRVQQQATEGKRKVAFGAPYPGKIVPVNLARGGRRP